MSADFQTDDLIRIGSDVVMSYRDIFLIELVNRSYWFGLSKRSLIIVRTHQNKSVYTNETDPFTARVTFDALEIEWRKKR